MTLDLEALRRRREAVTAAQAAVLAAATIRERRAAENRLMDARSDWTNWFHGDNRMDAILAALDRIPELERDLKEAHSESEDARRIMTAAQERVERVEAALRKIGSLPPEATRFSITSIALAALAPAPGRGGWLIGHAPGSEAVEVSPETFARVQAELDEDAAAPVGGEDDERHEGDGPAVGEGPAVKRPTPWRNPEVGDVVVTRTSGDGHGPARRREITGLTKDGVEYDDGRYYRRWAPGEGWMLDKGTSCVRSSWAAWCSKHAVSYLRAGVDLMKEEASRG